MWGKTYDSLKLHTGKHLSSLPGMSFPSGTSNFPSRSEFTEYLDRYVSRFDLPVRSGVDVTGIQRQDDEGWILESDGGQYHSRCVVVATGIMPSPFVPVIEGMDGYARQVIHSSEYKRPDGYAGQCVLVIGIGNSYAEITSELANAGVEVAVSVRSGANVVPRSVLGVPVQYIGWAMSWLPRSVQRSARKTR